MASTQNDKMLAKFAQNNTWTLGELFLGFLAFSSAIEFEKIGIDTAKGNLFEKTNETVDVQVLDLVDRDDNVLKWFVGRIPKPCSDD